MNHTRERKTCPYCGRLEGLKHKLLCRVRKIEGRFVGGHKAVGNLVTRAGNALAPFIEAMKTIQPPTPMNPKDTPTAPHHLPPWTTDESVLHNPDELTPEQVGDKHRLLLPEELDGRHRGVAKVWGTAVFRWLEYHCEASLKSSPGNTTCTYRVPLYTAWPPPPVEKWREEKEAHKAGKRIQVRGRWAGMDWNPWEDTPAPTWESNHPIYELEYRIHPNDAQAAPSVVHEAASDIDPAKTKADGDKAFFDHVKEERAKMTPTSTAGATSEFVSIAGLASSQKPVPPEYWSAIDKALETDSAQGGERVEAFRAGYQAGLDTMMMPDAPQTEYDAIVKWQARSTPQREEGTGVSVPTEQELWQLFSRAWGAEYMKNHAMEPDLGIKAGISAVREAMVAWAKESFNRGVVMGTSTVREDGKDKGIRDLIVERDAAEQARDEAVKRVALLESKLKDRDETVEGLNYRMMRAESATGGLQAAKLDAEAHCKRISIERDALRLEVERLRGRVDKNQEVG